MLVSYSCIAAQQRKWEKMFENAGTKCQTNATHPFGAPTHPNSTNLPNHFLDSCDILPHLCSQPNFFNPQRVQHRGSYLAWKQSAVEKSGSVKQLDKWSFTARNIQWPQRRHYAAYAQVGWPNKGQATARECFLICPCSDEWQPSIWQYGETVSGGVKNRSKIECISVNNTCAYILIIACY